MARTRYREEVPQKGYGDLDLSRLRIIRRDYPVGVFVCISIRTCLPGSLSLFAG